LYLRQRVIKGAGSRTAGLAMAFKLLLAAERSWRKLDSPELVPLVRAGVIFLDGVRVEREDAETLKQGPKTRRTKTKKDENQERDAA
jgi:hypothetical protein